MKKDIIAIAIADDHALFRATIAHLLSTNYNIRMVLQASSGKELLDQLVTITPDVILLDIEMPGMNGIETLSQIRKQYPALKETMLSTHNDHMLITALMQLGASAYLSKATDPIIIYETILDVLK